MSAAENDGDTGAVTPLLPLESDYMDASKRILTAQASIADEMKTILEQLTREPEVAGREVKAAAVLQESLARHGFTTTPNFLGHESGFLAERTNGPGGKVVFLAKYDALPGFDRGRDAHGCGHNWVGTLAAAAAIVVSKFLDRVPGTVAVVGAPTETFFGDPVAIRDASYFDDADAVFHSHLNDRNLLYSFPLPITTLELSFHGASSQAFSYPENGINAVDAAVDTITAIRQLKSQAQDFDRINYVIHEGGRSTEAVPDRCVLRVALGGTDQGRTTALTDKVAALADAAAERIGATVESRTVNHFPGLVNVREMHELVRESFETFGEDYDVFPRKIGRTALDVASVSHHCPMLYMFFGVPNWISHQPTLERVEASHSDAAKARLDTATCIFADSALHVLERPALRDHLHEAWRAEKRWMETTSGFSIERFA